MKDLAAKALEKRDWPLEQFEELTLVRSPLLKTIDTVAHAFTTRKGGNSPLPLDSFNLGRHWNTDESRADAMKNRKRLCDLLGLNSEDLAVPGQQHTNNIHFISAKNGMPPGPFHFPAIDAVATDRKQQPVLLHFADCVPVMLVDPSRKKICVIHAGWRGTAASIVKKSAELMCKELDCKPTDLHAAIGPAIGTCCYETGNEVIEGLRPTVSQSDSLVVYKDNSPHPDLKAFNAMQLLEAGVENIDVSSWCTACHPEIFYSHRQSAGQTGRQGALACLV
ncbi:MAG: peptidoglycan editing factor PgeF [Candidatus Obscuribacterales bacterium]|nr:peptidoglycan editing factor PgeF [Candidatus Obscuribacterales bacterium]